MKEKLNLTAPCLFGLESVLKFELQRLGAENISATDGRVNFQGDETIMVRANLWLRTAERVAIVLGSFKATTFTQLFDNVNQLPFEDFIGEFDSFPVKGWSLDSKLESIPSCQSIIKKSVATKLSKSYNRDVFPETGPTHQISFSIHKDMVTIMLDTTGEALHKRGYRQIANLAPIRETLAAGIVDFARIRDNSVVYDPMCGSGTLLIEAAQRAINMAPGLNRDFQVEKWGVSDPSIWEAERNAAKEAINRDIDFKAYGSDNNKEILAVAKSNAQKAGIEEFIEFSYQDISAFAPSSPSTVLVNPPYGERMLEAHEAAALYEVMGNVMPSRDGIGYYIIGPQEDFEEAFGKTADRRRKLYNGMLPCQLYMYFK